jgi:universal stress protein F
MEFEMPRTVIVPIHLAQVEKAQPMLDAARQIGGEDAGIVLVTVVEDVPGYIAAEMPSGILEQAAEEARKKLREIGRKAGLELPVDVRRGNAATAILAVASERDADVIVIASHVPGVQDYFLGSTAARVVRHAKCSVYVIR